jgi:hypothetical protein
LKGIVLFDLVERFVVDFGFGVAGVGGVELELLFEFGGGVEVVGICERLEDFREEEIFVAEELQGLLVKGGCLTVPEIEAGYVGE